MAVTRIRNPLAFGVSLLLLAAAGTLGLVLRHDAVDADFGAVEPGDDVVRLKGDLLPFQPPASNSWQPVRQLLSNVTLRLHDATTADEVLVTGVGRHAAGEDRVVYGAVVFSGVHPDDPARSLVVVEARSVYEPYFSW